MVERDHRANDEVNRTSGRDSAQRKTAPRSNRDGSAWGDLVAASLQSSGKVVERTPAVRHSSARLPEDEVVEVLSGAAVSAQCPPKKTEKIQSVQQPVTSGDGQRIPPEADDGAPTWRNLLNASPGLLKKGERVSEELPSTQALLRLIHKKGTVMQKTPQPDTQESDASKQEAPAQQDPTRGDSKPDAPKRKAAKRAGPEAEAPKTEAPKRPTAKRAGPEPEAPKPEAPKRTAAKRAGPEPAGPEPVAPEPATPVENTEGLKEIAVEDLLNGVVNVLGDGLGFVIDNGKALGVGVASGVKAGAHAVGGIVGKLKGGAR